MIPFKKRTSLFESEIKAIFYNKCAQNNIECYLEYTYKKSRFDIIIVYKNTIVLIVEVKSNKFIGEHFRYSQQYKKYISYGIPVSVVYDELCINNLIPFINEYFKILSNFAV